MSNFTVQICGQDTEVRVYIPEGHQDEVWSFSSETETFCGTIIDSTEAEASYTGMTLYSDCYECLSSLDNVTFIFNLCNGVGSPAFLPTDIGFLPESGSVSYGVYYRSDVLNSACISFDSVSYDGLENVEFVSAVSYNGCEECLFLETPRSGGTEANICQEICTTGNTTVTSVTPPHPEWTDGYGIQVTQLNMITLGGINGLNS